MDADRGWHKRQQSARDQALRRTVFVDRVQVGVLLTARQRELILPGAEKGRPVG
jgi:hypothetical protein